MQKSGYYLIANLWITEAFAEKAGKLMAHSQAVAKSTNPAS